MASLPDVPIPGQPAQNGAIEIPSAISTDKAETTKRENARALVNIQSYRQIFGHYDAIRFKAAYITRKRYGLPLNSGELLALVSLCGYIATLRVNLVSLNGFIDYYLHASNRRASITGRLRGIIKFGCVDLLDKKTIGTRYVGITQYGQQLTDLYFNVIEQLYNERTSRNDSLVYSDDDRFWKVPNGHEVENLSIVQATTRNKHLFNPSKYVE